MSVASLFIVNILKNNFVGKMYKKKVKWQEKIV